MTRHYYCVPLPYTALLRRITLVALLCAGGSGIAWSVYTMPRSSLGGMNQQLDAANDVLMARAASGRGASRADDGSSGTPQSATADGGGEVLAMSSQ